MMLQAVAASKLTTLRITDLAFFALPSYLVDTVSKYKIVYPDNEKAYHSPGLEPRDIWTQQT